MKLTNNDYVGRALSLLAAGLEPAIAKTLSPRLPAGIAWPDLVRKRDEVNGKFGKKYESNDLYIMLRMLSEKFGNLGQPFDAQLGRSGSRYVAELQDVRNNWAHNVPFTEEDAYRAIDTAQRLAALMTIPQSDDLVELRRELQAGMAAAEESAAAPTVIPAYGPPTPAHETGETGETGEPLAPSETAASAESDALPAAPFGTPTPLEGAPALLDISQTQLDVSLATIEISASSIVSYAMAHNRFPVVSQVVVKMAGPSTPGAKLTIGLDTEDGPLGEPREIFVDLVEGEETSVPQVGFLLDPKAMAGLEEARPGILTAVLTADGETIGRATEPVTVLAAKHWLEKPKEAALELLAAFVQPNDHALTSLVDEASMVLATTTGSASFHDAYGQNSDGTYADAVANALITAMRARGIRYALPPAKGWNVEGQKVRSASEVLEGRLGTCLDTTVVLAAALERVGLRPLLFVTRDHAFLGYWRSRGGLQMPAATDIGTIAKIVNLVQLGEIEVVETTLLTTDNADASLADIHAAPRRHQLAGDLSEFDGVADVLSARRERILPLPARSVTPEGEVTYTEYSAPVVAPEKYVPAPAPEGQTLSRPVAPPRVEKWKNSLLDLSLRNRLISFPPSARFPLAVPEEGLGQFEDYLSDGDPITLLPSDQLSAVAREQGIRSGAELHPNDRLSLLANRQVFSSVTSETYLRKFRALAYKAKTIVEESGANNLYVAIGSLIWTLKDREIRSPLILVPVTLKSRTKGGGYQLVLDESGMSTPNFCLLEKLRLEFNVTIPDLADPKLDASGIDLDAALRATREAIAIHGLPARVEDTVDLAVLQFAKFRLWKDLDENWEALAGNPLVRHLIEQPQEAFVDTAALTADVEKDIDLDELLTKLPISADSSQLGAVAAATAGRTFVLEGPPGTGKSQTITNLLAKSIADGKRVLFVAEKRAALQVVQSRLAAVGLGPFTLDLHDRGSRPNEIRAHLKKALAAQTTIDEDGLLNTSNALDMARLSLNRYTQSLHEPNEAGQSFYAAHNSALASADAEYTLPVPADWAGAISREELQAIRTLLRDVPDVALRARPAPHHAWEFIDVQADQPLDEADVLRRVAEFDTALGDLELSEELGAALTEASTAPQLSTLSRLATRPSVDLAIINALRTPDIAAQLASLRAELDGLEPSFADVLAVVTPAILFQNVVAIDQAAKAAADSGPFGRKKRLSAVVEQFAAVLLPGQVVDPQAVVPLAERFVTFQAAAVDVYTRVNSLPGIHTAPTWNPYVAEQRREVLDTVTWQQWVADATNGATVTDPSEKAFRAALETFAASSHDMDGSTGAKIDRFAAALDGLLGAPGTTPVAWSEWRGGERLLDRWVLSRAGRDTSTTRGVSLAAWVAWRRILAPLRSAGLEAAYEALLTGEIPAEYTTSAFERGFAVAAQNERLATTGLQSFDPVRHNHQIERYTESARSLRDLQVSVAPYRVVERRTYDPKTAGGRVGELQKQLDRQRGGLSVRDLMITYGDLIIQATPCILVSPDSVARFFLAHGDQFDIVVFDEASQVRVADAIGAMGRANSVVVVGDSKQMPPTSFAEPSGGDDDDESAGSTDFLLQDEESILAECVQARVERQFLSWHYRSQDESLIAFSNRYYYDEQLTSFPAPAHGQVDAGIGGHGISLVRVNGHFIRSGSTKELRTNPVEAEAIVAEIQHRFDASPEAVPSLGVITFNAQQRTLIEALLRDSGDDRITEALEMKDGLFVKNLENVQGDERDTILFSTAFSKNDSGALPLNFGPLTNYGGERRLNVAITRARRQVIMFSSFDPQELRADETTSRGIKDLRAYLELAQKGPQQTLRARSGPVVTDRHRDEVAAALRDRGLSIQTDVGLSDFKVDIVVATADDPDEPVLAVLLDGLAWSQRHTVADRDALPVEVLEGLMHWPAVERVWLPEWLDDSTAVVNRLEATAKDARKRVEEAAVAEAAAVEAAAVVEAESEAEVAEFESAEADDAAAVSVLAAVEPAPIRFVSPCSARRVVDEEPATEETVDDSPVSVAPEYEPVSARAVAVTMERTEIPVAPEVVPGGSFQPWIQHTDGTIAVLDDWRSRVNFAAIQRVIEEIVEIEGPVQTVRLAKLVASAFGLNKVSGPRILTVIECVPRHLGKTADEKFIWPTEMDPDEWSGFRPAAEGTTRALETISNRELSNAMADLVRFAGLPEEELLRSTLGVFGGVRLTTAIRGRLLEALRFAESKGRVARGSGDLIVAPDRATRSSPEATSGPASPRDERRAVPDPDFPMPVAPILDLPTVRLSTTYSGAFFSREQRFDMTRDRFAIAHEPRNDTDLMSVAVYNGLRKVAYLDPIQAPFYAQCLDRLGGALEVDGELSADGEWFVHVPDSSFLLAHVDSVSRV